MMTEPPKHTGSQRSSGGCWIFALLLTLVMGAGFVIIAGAVGAWVYVGTARRHAMAEQQRAVEQAMRAQVEAEMAPLSLPELPEDEPLLEAKPQEEAAAVQQLELRIDAEGKCTLGGRAMDSGALLVHLQTLAAGTDLLRVAVRADRRCSFGHVANVLSVCREAGAEIHDVRASDDP